MKTSVKMLRLFNMKFKLNSNLKMSKTNNIAWIEGLSHECFYGKYLPLRRKKIKSRIGKSYNHVHKLDRVRIIMPILSIS